MRFTDVEKRFTFVKLHHFDIRCAVLGVTVFKNVEKNGETKAIGASGAPNRRYPKMLLNS